MEFVGCYGDVMHFQPPGVAPMCDCKGCLVVLRGDSAIASIFKKRFFEVPEAIRRAVLGEGRENAKPWAKYTVEAARAAERGLGNE